MISVYTFAYNEEKLLPFFISWYRSRFPGCEITVFDNESTDKTKEIAESLNCRVVTYFTDNKMSEIVLRDMKNNCWKDSKYNWVAVVDVDELVEINFVDLVLEGKKGTTLIDFDYWTVVNKKKESLLHNMNFGVWHYKLRAKRCLFNPRAIKEINYEIGAHKANPVGHVQYSSKPYRFFHYRFLSLKEVIQRHKNYRERQDAESKKNGWGIQYHYSNFRLWLQWKLLCLRSRRFK